MNIAAGTRAITRAILAPVAEFSARRWLFVLLLGLMLGGVSIFAASRDLGVSTDTGEMFADSLPWKQRSVAIDKAFPQNDNLLVAVIDGATPEQAEDAASKLSSALSADKKNFTSVTRPDALPYLRNNAFLLIDTADLQDVLDHTVDAQPFLGQLAADPSLRGLLSALSLVATGVSRGAADTAALEPAMAKFHAALAATVAGQMRPLSWQTLLGGKIADLTGTYRFVLAKPVLDNSAIETGAAPTQALRAAIAALPEVQTRQVRVRLTGPVILQDEEFATVAKGAVAGLVASFLLVLFWLYLAVRSWRLMLPVIVTLVLGLLLTTGFAAIAIGTLNLISVAFAVLFVGIAVDFAIQFAVRFRERHFLVPEIIPCLRETGSRAGAQILVASLATAAGFLAFTPTDFTGVAELGAIAGAGMLIAFFCTLTILPAMLALCRPRVETAEIGFSFAKPIDRWLAAHCRAVVAGFLVMGVAGAIAATSIGFDGDPLNTKDQTTEAVRTLKDLMADPVTNPYSIEAILPSRQAAIDAGKRIAADDLGKEVVSFDSFIPDDQDKKLAMIADAASILLPSLSAPTILPPPGPAELRQAASGLAETLAHLDSKLLSHSALAGIRDDLTKLSHANDATLVAANAAMLRYLPAQLEQLKDALTAHRITDADIPNELRRDWLLQDGRARIQIFPKDGVYSGKALREFVKNVEHDMPQAAGSAIWIVHSATTILHAFGMAAASALAGIALILALALRRAFDVALVMLPLLVSALLTALILHLAGLSLNFANIIALPLLLGVGVSFNIYFVMNWRAGISEFLGTATARAVLFSALTTGTAFGSLALSRHPGTASMGDLLLISLGATVVTTLFFVPALLACAGCLRRAEALPLHSAGG
jgi:hopanoid biosynthesis associated RND transporter like protein HpnN